MPTQLKPYNVHCGSDGRWYPDGPGIGYSYYSGTLFSENRFEIREAAHTAVRMMNDAYREGYQQAQRDIQKALGIK